MREGYALTMADTKILTLDGVEIGTVTEWRHVVATPPHRPGKLATRYHVAKGWRTDESRCEHVRTVLDVDPSYRLAADRGWVLRRGPTHDGARCRDCGSRLRAYRPGRNARRRAARREMALQAGEQAVECRPVTVPVDPGEGARAYHSAAEVARDFGPPGPVASAMAAQERRRGAEAEDVELGHLLAELDRFGAVLPRVTAEDRERARAAVEREGGCST